MSDPLNACGCCPDESQLAPAAIDNRPGLSAIAYRSGTHSSFRRAMLNRLSAADMAPLHALGARADDDPTIALLDAWATIADVQTFYSERIANELYLRTAGERRSLRELAGLIGYTPRPGLAASAYLAFTLDESPGAPEQAAQPISIAAGLKVQSIPGPGERAQTFETTETLTARVEWNAIRPQLTRRHPLPNPDAPDRLLFSGMNTGLRPGDRLLVAPEDGGALQLRRVAAVRVPQGAQDSVVELEAWDSHPVGSGPDLPRPVTQIDASPTNPTYQQLLQPTMQATNLEVQMQIHGYVTKHVFAHLRATRRPSPGVLAFRTTAAKLGYQKPVEDSNLEELVPMRDFIDLDAVYPQILRGSWLVMSNEERADILRVNGTTVLTRNLQLPGSSNNVGVRVSRITLDRAIGTYMPHTTTVFAQSELLPLARLPIKDAVAGAIVDLDGLIDRLYIGQALMFSGELADTAGVWASEVATIAGVEEVCDDDSHTRVILAKALGNSYVRASLTISGNVARATHGETVEEILGSGDARVDGQRFALRQGPLTYTGAATAVGVQSSLELRVNGLRWQERPSLYGHPADERIYALRSDDDGQTSVQINGRLPSGQNNVRARYRKGIGAAGLLRAGQLSLLASRPLGVRGVTNPLPTADAADPESTDELRHNAPLTVLTLDRIVSLRDYEDFARAFSGVAKALATWTWDGQRRGIFVTVAGPDGADITSDSDLYTNLLAAMRICSDPNVSLQVRSYRRAFFYLKVGVKVDPSYLADQVRAAVEAALRARFGFAARAFGQGVAQSELYAAIHAVPGVVAADIDTLQRHDALTGPILADRLAAAAPQAGATGPLAAELLLLAPTSPAIKELP